MYLNQDKHAAGGMNSTKSNGQAVWFSSPKKISLLLRTSVGTRIVASFHGAILEMALTTGSIAKYHFVDVSIPTEITFYGHF